jgi:hypothetical protein
MKKLLLTSLVVVGYYGLTAQAQVVNAPLPTAQIQNYYTDAGQKENVDYFKDLILEGCTTPLAKQPPIDQEELSFDVDHVKAILQDKFSKSFAENPQIKTMMDKALDAIAADPSCAQSGNDCRTRLVATATYFMQPLRPNVPGCEGYVKYDYTTKAAKKKRAEDNGYVKECEAELLLRQKSLKGVGRSNGGMDQRGAYQDILIQEQNNALMDIQQLVLLETEDKEYKKKKLFQLNKSAMNIAVCGPVANGVIYSYPLKIGLYGEAFGGLETNKPVAKKPDPVPEKKTEPCVEEIKVLHSEFVPMNFEEGSSTVKSSEIKPVKQKIEDFISSHSNLVITNIDVTSSASKTPFYKTEGSKKVYDKEYSDGKNLALSESRANFAQTALDSIKSGHPELAEAKYTTVGAINGPDFDKDDLSDREVTSKDPKYKAQVEKLYTQYKEMLAKDAMIKSSQELLDTKRFTNLYEAKYKPYQGFKIVISGYSKEARKCGDKDKDVDPVNKVKPKDNTTSGKSQN